MEHGNESLVALVIVAVGACHFTSEASGKLKQQAQDRAELLANI